MTWGAALTENHQFLYLLWWQAVWFLVRSFQLSRPTLVFSHQFLGYLSEKNYPKVNKTSEPESTPLGKSPAPECWWLLMVKSRNLQVYRGSNAVPTQAPGGYAVNGQESTCNAGDWLLSLGQEDPLEKGISTHSSILAWRIPWTEEPGGLQSMESQRV